MPSKMPPVPPANRSRTGPGEAPKAEADTRPRGGEPLENAAQQGDHANIRQNIPRQGSRTPDRGG